MPPVESSRRQIITALVDVLRGMNDGNAYHYPVKDPDSVTDNPERNIFTEDPGNLPLFKVEPTPDGRRDFYPAMQLVNFFRVNIMARMDADDGSDPSRATTWENLAADLEKVLAVDITLGGLVYDVRVLEPQPVLLVGTNIVILMQPLEIRLHRTYGAP